MCTIAGAHGGVCCDVRSSGRSAPARRLPAARACLMRGMVVQYLCLLASARRRIPEQQPVQPSADTYDVGDLAYGQQSPRHVRGGSHPRIMTDDQPLARTAEHDFGGDGEAGQPHRVDPDTSDLCAPCLHRSVQVCQRHCDRRLADLRQSLGEFPRGTAGNIGLRGRANRWVIMVVWPGGCPTGSGSMPRG